MAFGRSAQGECQPGHSDWPQPRQPPEQYFPQLDEPWRSRGLVCFDGGFADLTKGMAQSIVVQPETAR